MKRPCPAAGNGQRFGRQTIEVLSAFAKATARLAPPFGGASECVQGSAQIDLGDRAASRRRREQELVDVDGKLGEAQTAQQLGVVVRPPRAVGVGQQARCDLRIDIRRPFGDDDLAVELLFDGANPPGSRDELVNDF